MRRMIAVALIGAGLAGCGGGDDSSPPKYDGEKARVAAVVDDLGEASRDGNGERICSSLFTDNLAISIRRAARQPCADEVAQNVFDSNTSFTVEDVSVIGDPATAKVKDQEDRVSVLLLLREREHWRIARIS